MSQSCTERESVQGFFCVAKLPGCVTVTEKEAASKPNPVTFCTSSSLQKGPQVEGSQQSFDIEFDPPLEGNYKCPICLMALQAGVQMPCGQRFCRSCIEKLIRDSGQKYPVDNKTLQKDQLFPHSFAKREILSLTVLCPNMGCNHKMELQQLDAHKEHCQFAMMPCPLCQDLVCKRQVEQHKAHQCPRRHVSCPNCMENLTSQERTAHEQVCPLASVVCKYCGMELIRDQLASHYGTDCLNAPAVCPFSGVGCQGKMQRNELAQHMQEFTQLHMRYMADSLRGWSCNRSLLSPVEYCSSGVGVGRATACKYSEEQQDLGETVQQLERRLVQQQQHLRELGVCSGAHATQLKELCRQLHSLEECVREQEAHQWRSVYVWRVEGFSTHLRRHEAGEPVVVHSPGFHTGRQGYKLCLRLHLQTASAPHWANYISLFVHTMQGEFDGELLWPLQGTIQLAILDQVEGRHHTEVMKTNPKLLAFQRPALPCNPKGFGYDAFMHLDVLQKHRHLQDDTLLVRCVVTLYGDAHVCQDDP